MQDRIRRAEREFLRNRLIGRKAGGGELHEVVSRVGRDPCINTGRGAMFPRVVSLRRCQPTSLVLPPKRVTIAGPAGSLEALLETPAGADGSRVAVVCHPHPVYGGTMTNKVVHMLAKSFNERGVPARALQLSRRGRQRRRLRRRRRRDAGRARGDRLGCAALAGRGAVGCGFFLRRRDCRARGRCARRASVWSQSHQRFSGSQSMARSCRVVRGCSCRAIAMNWSTPARSNAGWRPSRSRRGSRCCRASIISFTAGSTSCAPWCWSGWSATEADE